MLLSFITAMMACNDPHDPSRYMEDDTTCESSWYYEDVDGDGYGDFDAAYSTCEHPGGNYVENDGDCDDTDAAIHPDAQEVCDVEEVDEDCDGYANDADSSTSTEDMVEFYYDGDGDGYGDGATLVSACELPYNYVEGEVDCDDSDMTINPGEEEICDYHDVDEDCSDSADDNDPNTTDDSKVAWYYDHDEDGFGGSEYILMCEQPEGLYRESNDCRDDRPEINPDMDANPATVWDTNCDGVDDREGETYYDANAVAWTVASANLIAEADLATSSTFEYGETDWDVYVSTEERNCTTDVNSFTSVLVGEYTTMRLLPRDGANVYENCVITPEGVLSFTPGEEYGIIFQVDNNQGSAVHLWLYTESGYATGEEPTKFLDWTLYSSGSGEVTVSGVFMPEYEDEGVIICSDQTDTNQVHATHMSVHKAE